MAAWPDRCSDPLWRGHARYTLATGILAVLSLSVSGLAYYVFLVRALTWISTTGSKLWRSTTGGTRE